MKVQKIVRLGTNFLNIILRTLFQQQCHTMCDFAQDLIDILPKKSNTKEFLVIINAKK